MTHGVEALVLGRGHVSHYSEYSLSSSLSIYIILIAIVVNDYNAASSAIVDFYLFMTELLKCKFELFWQEVCAVSDTQMIVKHCGSFVEDNNVFVWFFLMIFIVYNNEQVVSFYSCNFGLRNVSVIKML